VALLIAALFACLGAWLLLVITSRMPDGLWRFIRDVMAYTLRVEAYALLIHDRFPSFSLSADVEPATLARES
jgi:hypothetical protein